jgi:hypothetical protein
LKIRVPVFAVRIYDRHILPVLDAYSDWSSQPTGPSFRIMSWRYTILWRDWVSIAQVLLLALAFMWWSAGGPMAFGVGVACGILAWIAIEANLWGK